MQGESKELGSERSAGKVHLGPEIGAENDRVVTTGSLPLGLISPRHVSVFLRFSFFMIFITKYSKLTEKYTNNKIGIHI